MQTLDQLLKEYSASHQNRTNKIIHYFCVPAIFFSIIGLLMSIPATYLETALVLDNPFIENWATFVLVLALIYYFLLSPSLAVKVFIFAAFCVVGNYYIGQLTPLWMISLAIFIVSWIVQFVGHEIEGKKPSFLKDVQFLLIGPAWILKNVFG